MMFLPRAFSVNAQSYSDMYYLSDWWQTIVFACSLFRRVLYELISSRAACLLSHYSIASACLLCSCKHSILAQDMDYLSDGPAWWHAMSLLSLSPCPLNFWYMLILSWFWVSCPLWVHLPELHVSCPNSITCRLCMQTSNPQDMGLMITSVMGLMTCLALSFTRSFESLIHVLPLLIVRVVPFMRSSSRAACLYLQTSQYSITSACLLCSCMDRLLELHVSCPNSLIIMGRMPCLLCRCKSPILKTWIRLSDGPDNTPCLCCLHHLPSLLQTPNYPQDMDNLSGGPDNTPRLITNAMSVDKLSASLAFSSANVQLSSRHG